MTKCLECGAENDDTELKCGACNRWLPPSKPRESRHGSAAKRPSRRAGARGFDPRQVLTPVTNGAGKAMWNGERKQLGGFSDAFVEEFFKYYYVKDAKVNPKGLSTGKSSGKTTYQCVKCKEFLMRKKDDGAADNWISINHRVPIRDYVVSHTELRYETIDGHHWSYYLLEDCKKAHLTQSNLEPMCQSCNSALGGNKDLDSSMIDHCKSLCPGGKCKDHKYHPY